jgi:sodium-dependent dicarboxylate transporter 2/3/5
MTQAKSGDIVKNAILIVVPILCGLFILFFDLSPGHREITYTAAIALLMAIWWITEAIPLAATSLLPLILFPIFGIMDGKAVSSEYINNVIFIFIGGFLVALAMERWNLHKRLALRILKLLGVQPRFILLGFMSATAFISMWISNTATAMMMVPIGIAVVSNLEEILGIEKVRKFAIAIFLGIAYSASLGGIATLIGTPPNLVFVKIFNTFFPKAPVISFAQWFFFALPVSVVFLFIVWGLLSLMFCPRKGLGLDEQIFSDQYKALGPISFEEKIVLVDFFILVLLWIFRADINIGSFTIPGWSNLFPYPEFFDDGTVGITMAFILFLIPTRNRNGSNGGRRILTWKTASGLPWDIVLLFGGGFALASGFTTSGLSAWLGKQLEGLGSLPPILVVACICFLITFLTELTSNTATAQILLPILATLAVSIRVNPLLLMIPGTISASLGFMLPVGTPPNAIVFGTKRVRIADMVRVGLILDIIGIIIVTLAIFLLGKAVFGIDLSQMPAWMIK